MRRSRYQMYRSRWPTSRSRRSRPTARIPPMPGIIRAARAPPAAPSSGTEPRGGSGPTRLTGRRPSRGYSGMGSRLPWARSARPSSTLSSMCARSSFCAARPLPVPDQGQHVPLPVTARLPVERVLEPPPDPAAGAGHRDWLTLLRGAELPVSHRIDADGRRRGSADGQQRQSGTMTNPTTTITIRSPNAAIGLRSRGIHHQIHRLMTNHTY